MKKLLPILLFLAVVLSACGQAASTTPSPSATGSAATPAATGTPAPAAKALDKVKVGTIGVFGDSAIYLASERGYFKEQGIEVDIQKFAAPAELIAAIGTGQIDAGDGPANV